LLADLKADLPEIEAIAASRGEQQIRELESGALNMSGDLPEVVAFKKFLPWLQLGEWKDLLGWIYLQEGRTEDAERQLTTAETLADIPNLIPGSGTYLEENLLLLVHLGRLYTAKGDYAKAEHYLGRAISGEWLSDMEHPAIAAYKDLYVKQHRTKDGLDPYMLAVTEKDRERRKIKILSARIADPKPIPPFTLKTIDGRTVTSESLKGKIVVINFWGTWCGECRLEMPELEKFYEKYKANPNVVFLALSYDDSVDQARAFIKEKKYTFPVLMDADYVSGTSVRAYPTTWFIDREGRKVFDKLGGSLQVVEEFSWRVEAIRDAPKSQSATSAQ